MELFPVIRLVFLGSYEVEWGNGLGDELWIVIGRGFFSGFLTILGIRWSFVALILLNFRVRLCDLLEI